MLNQLAEYQNAKLPQKISYAITKNLITLQKEYDVYEAQLNKIIASYSDHILKDENNNPIMNNGIPVVDQSVFKDYHEQIEDLLDEDAFDYDSNNMYTALSPNDNIRLQNLLAEPKGDEK